jgi:ABC-type antimicrobial peptide transport system permease subunit
MTIYKTPRDLVDAVGYLNTVLRLKPKDDNEWELRNNKNLYKKAQNPLVYLYNFVMNNISSMVYLNKNKAYLRIENKGEIAL